MPPGPHPRPAPGSDGAGFDPAFVRRVLTDATRAGVRCYGIAGLQGSGKSTLARQVAAMAAREGRRVVVLSIDDTYLNRPERLALARDVHPLLATRGPPGTHDTALACDTLDALAAGAAVALPRFDKLGDRRLPAREWPRAAGADLAILEGWFNQVPPQPPDALAAPVNALERDADPDGRWRAWCNAALRDAYPPLWTRIDRALFLRPPGFEVVPGWRWEQECALRAVRGAGATGMDRAGVFRFVQHFERVSRQALRTLPDIADWTVRLDAQRRPLDPAGDTQAADA